MRRALREIGNGSDFQKALEKAEWIGEVHWRPYSRRAPLEDPHAILSRATGFELSEPVQMAKNAKKHLVLLAAPCDHATPPGRGPCARYKIISACHIYYKEVHNKWN